MCVPMPLLSQQCIYLLQYYHHHQVRDAQTLPMNRVDFTSLRPSPSSISGRMPFPHYRYLIGICIATLIPQNSLNNVSPLWVVIDVLSPLCSAMAGGSGRPTCSSGLNVGWTFIIKECVRTGWHGDNIKSWNVTFHRCYYTYFPC